MATTVQDWLRQGEALHAALAKEYHDLDRQVQDLEAKRAVKLAELNQVAKVLGKAATSTEPANAAPPARGLSAELIGGRGAAIPFDDGDDGSFDRIIDVPVSGNGNGNAAANANIARALSGKFATGPAPGAQSGPAPKMIDAVPTKRS